MSNSELPIQTTQHAFLVAWGWFAEHLGLIQQLQAVSLKQKHYHHRPQTKVLEFLVAILAGLQHLQEISLAAHPLDKDQAVAQAWAQPAWADYSGVSRTLSSLSWQEVKQIVQVLEQISQPYLTAEIKLLHSQGNRVRLDGDLTGLPVSNSSRTYPHAAFGHMNDDIRLGYQAALVCLASPTYGRLWLSVAHHPGDTVSCTQAEALVLAAEARLQRWPRRRTELLCQRIHAFEQQVTQTDERLQRQQQAVQQAKKQLAETEQQVREYQKQVDALEQDYQSRQHKERPTSRLAQARKRLQAAVKRAASRTSACKQAQRRLDKTTAQWSHQQAELAALSQRLLRFEQDNAANVEAVEAEFRLDAGFGTYENVALLIEMGYELSTKPHSHKVVASLKQQVDDSTAWTRVGANAELVAWPRLQLKHCPYALDVALERFYTGKTLKHSALFHFGVQPVTEQLPGWFEQYNGRQTIEAGMKESKQVFYLHHLKVRSEPAIYLQEAFVLFAANFIRWAAHWLEGQAQPEENALNVHKLGVKRQVQVAAHVSAQVIQDEGGQVVKVQRAERLCRPPAQSRRRWMIAAPTPILKISAIFQRIAFDCTTVTLALGKDGIKAFYEAVPTLNVMTELAAERDSFYNKAIGENDATDISFLCVAIPYCDVVVTEKFWVSIIEKKKLNTKYNTNVLRGLRDLGRYLNSLDV